MRVLVCGSRNWTDKFAVGAALFGAFAHSGDDPDVVVVEGQCRGADAIAAEWARNFATEHLSFPAAWDRYGKSAGAIRNQQMLDEGQPDIVFAFSTADPWYESRGTADMVRRASEAGIPTYVVTREDVEK